jgi:glycosidase
MTPIESMNGNDIRKYKMAMTVLATMRGIPQLYYGSEIGMAGNKDKGMQLFVKIFQVGMAMRTTFTKEGRTATQNEYFDFG